MIAVLGHKHTGTTCLAQCLRQAGVDFGTNCNIKSEDHRLFQIFPGLIKDVIWEEKQKRIYQNILQTMEGEPYGVKHPYLALVLDHWPLNGAIITVRSPVSWMKRCKEWSQEGLKNWKIVYEPLSRLGYPMVDFDSPTLEGDITHALAQMGYAYQGGVEMAKRHYPRFEEAIPKETENIWGRLENGIHRTCH
jgi:hypothetical protein